MALPVDELVPFDVDVECDEPSVWLADTPKLPPLYTPADAPRLPPPHTPADAPAPTPRLTLPLEDSFLPSVTVSVMLSVDVDESVTLSLLDSEVDSFVESVSL